MAARSTTDIIILIIIIIKFIITDCSFFFSLISFLEWKDEKDPEKAAETYRRDLLQQSETYRSLKYVMDMHESPEEKERAVVVFYKQNNINWASPLCVFLKGTIQCFQQNWIV